MISKAIHTRRKWSRLLAVVVSMAMASSMTVTGVGFAADGSSAPPTTLDGVTVEQGNRPDRLESGLAQLAEVRAGEGAGAARQFGEAWSLEVTDDTVEVIIEVAEGQLEGARDRLGTIGVESTGSYENLIRANVPIDELEWLSGQPEVLYVRTPMTPQIEAAEPMVEIDATEATLVAPEDLSAAGATAITPAAVNVLDDGFESWPGPWGAYYGGGYAEVTWGQTSYRASEGSYSAYCAGSAYLAPGPYVDDMQSWLMAGPYDFSTVADATLYFDMWIDLEEGFDELFVGYSTDGTNFSGGYTSADTLAWVPTYIDCGDAAGASNVWIAFVFFSDYIFTEEGVYIDDVTLETTTSSIYTSEGVAETNADVTHDAGYDGTGVKVGILDAGFYGYEAKLGTELPASVTCWGGSDLGPEGNGLQEHGTAVAETVHDMAPGAELYLAQFSDEVDFAAAAAWMVSQGVQVINMSAGWSGVTPGDGTGVVNDIVDGTVASGVFWANSAGNNRERHWMGDFTGSDAWLDWDTGIEVQIFSATAGQPVEGVLSWDDDWDAATQDYDLALLWWNDTTWEVIAWSNSPQNGTPGQRPVEGMSGTVGDDGLYAWGVYRASATSTEVSFDFFDSWRELSVPVYARSICTPADNGSAGFMAVGAMGRSPGFLQEDYSSEGPTRDGRLAPEIAGPADTSNSVYEYFTGTSASSPHVAGAAALILQANPTFEPAQIEAHLEADAVDLGDAGPDTQYGHGGLWVDVMVAPNQAPAGVDDEYSTDIDELLSVSAPGVLANDSDPDGDPITAVQETDVSHGDLTFNSDGSFDYDPDPGYSGADSFTYRATDGDLYSGYVTVDITVIDTGVPELGLSEDPLDFGEVDVGDNMTRTITVTNTGSGTLAVDSVDLSGWDLAEYAIVLDEVSGQTFGAGESGDISVKFTPTAAYSGAPSFGRWSGGYAAQYEYYYGSLVAIRMNTYPVNTGGSGDCSYSVVADSRPSGGSKYVYGGDRYVLSTRIPVEDSYVNEFLYTSSLPGGFADSITFDGYRCTGNPTPSLIRLADVQVEIVWGTAVDPDAEDETVPVFGVGTPAGTASNTTYVPVEGPNRYDTAIQTSQQAFADGTAECVVIATGQNWPDALGGAALAAAKNGPILLTYPTALYAGISDEIDRLGATEAFILGSAAAVSVSVENALKTKLGSSNVTRIGGSDRYETAELIAAATVAELESDGGYDGTAFVATGANFPDALAASPLAAANGWPIFLASPTSTPPISVMQGLGVTDVLILGGTPVVSTTQESALQAAFPSHVMRLAGPDRYATGVAVATYGVDHAGLGWEGLAVSTGQNFPDALAGGVLTGRNGSVMLLTASTWLPTVVADALTDNRDDIWTVYYLGGTPAVSQGVRDTITSLLR